MICDVTDGDGLLGWSSRFQVSIRTHAGHWLAGRLTHRPTQHVTWCMHVTGGHVTQVAARAWGGGRTMQRPGWLTAGLPRTCRKTHKLLMAYYYCPEGGWRVGQNNRGCAATATQWISRVPCEYPSTLRDGRHRANQILLCLKHDTVGSGRKL